MTEPLLLESDALPAPAPPPRPRRRGVGVVIVLVVLVLIGAAVWLALELRHRSLADAGAAAIWQQDQAALRSGIETLTAAVTQLERGQQANSDRLDAANATNRVLREELLGMGERAALLEDAVARLADQRLRGETVLRLNEAEFLLLLGAERLRLFGDPASAIQAFALAEASLASLDDPALATLRQTLAQELIELRSVPQDPRPPLRAELSALSAALDALPPSRRGEIATADTRDSRLVRLLSQLVTVRQVGERDVVLGPVQRETALTALRLQFELAQAALARPDPDAFRTALAQIRSQSERLFDLTVPAGATYADTLDRIASAQLLPELPALGATLGELRGLRATRTVGQDDGSAANRALDGTAPAAIEPPAANGTSSPAVPATAPASTPSPQPESPRPTDGAPSLERATPLPEVERAPTDGDKAGAVE